MRAWAFAEGDPIIYLVNDYNKRLWNGSLGRIESIVTGENGKPALLRRLEEAKHEIREDDFHNIDLAYAITVHKAQGSQFKKVIVPIIRSRLLDRTLIYTAMTRGIEQVVFIGDRGTFVRAIVRHSHCSDRSASRYKSEA